MRKKIGISQLIEIQGIRRKFLSIYQQFVQSITRFFFQLILCFHKSYEDATHFIADLLIQLYIELIKVALRKVIHNMQLQYFIQQFYLNIMKTSLRSASESKNKQRNQDSTVNHLVQLSSHDNSVTNSPFNKSYEQMYAVDKTTGNGMEETDGLLSTPFGTSLNFATAKQSSIDAEEDEDDQDRQRAKSANDIILINGDQADSGAISSSNTAEQDKPQLVFAIKDLTERIIFVKIRISVEGESSESLVDYITQVGRLFNQAAIELLAQDEPDEALQMLQATQEILDQVDQKNSKVSQLASLTLNNLSCVFKRKGEIQEAQECLKKALKNARLSPHETASLMSPITSEDELESMIEENQPLFHMNLCALFSQQGSHEKAKTHASIAVKDLERSVMFIKYQIEDLEVDMVSPKMMITDMQSDQENVMQTRVEAIAVLKNKFKDRISLLAIAYFNLGCEYEHLNLLEDCLETYQRAKGLQMGRYGHQALEQQFITSIKQVRQRLRDQGRSSNGKPRSKKSRTKQLPRCQSVKGKFFFPMSPGKADSVKVSQIGSRLEKTFEAILQMNRVDGAPGSFESSTKQALSQRPNSESRPAKQRMGSVTNSETRLKEIKEEQNRVGTPFINSSAEVLLLERQQITPVKAEMARTGNSFAPRGKPIEPDQPNRRVVSSIRHKRRPSSANNHQEDPFESNLSNQQIQQAAYQTSVPLSVSTNWKATKCLKKANWTKQWFQNAYVSVDASTKLEDALASASATENQIEAQKPGGEIVEDINSQNSQNNNKIFNIEKEAFNANSAAVQQFHTQTLINLRPPQHQNMMHKRAPRGSKQLTKSNKRAQSQAQILGLINQQQPESMVGENGGEINKEQKDHLLRDFMQRYVYALPTNQQNSQKQLGMITPKRIKTKSRSRSKKLVHRGGGAGSPIQSTALLPQITGQPMQQYNYSRPAISSADLQHRAKLRAAFSSKAQLKNNNVDKIIHNKLTRSSSVDQNDLKQYLVTRNQAFVDTSVSANNQQKPRSGCVDTVSKSYSQTLGVVMSKKQRAAMKPQQMSQKQLMTKQHLNLMNIDFFRRNSSPSAPDNNLVVDRSKQQFMQTLSPQVNLKNKHTLVQGASRSQCEQRRGSGHGRQKQSSQAKMLKQQRAQNPGVLLYTGQLEAAERYTQGPIVQVIKPFSDGERQLLVTQAINLKNNKPEVLIRQLIQQARIKNGKQSVQKGKVVNGPWPSKPPTTVTQPAIATQFRQMHIMPPQNPPNDQRQQQNAKESKFTKGVRSKVIRSMQKIIDKTQVFQDSGILQRKIEAIQMQTSDDGRSAMEEEQLPVTISEEPIADEEEVGSGPFNLLVDKISGDGEDSNKLKATVVIQAFFRGNQARLSVLRMKAVLEKEIIINSTITLELDDDYKDDAFDSVDGKSEEINSVARLINCVDDQSIRTEYHSASARIQAENKSQQTNDDSASVVIDEESIIDEFHKNTESLVIQETAIGMSQSAQDYLLKLNVQDVVQQSYDQAILEREKEDLEKLNQVKKADGATQTSMLIIRKTSSEKEESVHESYAQQIEAKEIKDMAFQTMDEAELILCEEAVVPGNYKIQVVLLPFRRDLGGVKLGFKGIKLDEPNFQNELIHIDLSLSQDQLKSDKAKVSELIDRLLVDKGNGNLSLPQEGLKEIALFTMLVVSEDAQKPEREVIAIYQNKQDFSELSSGHVILQTMTESMNKVTIPIKKQPRKVKLADFKVNLEKHLPRIVYVDQAGNVVLSADERERIGRVLPNGQAMQDISNHSSDGKALMESSQHYMLNQSQSNTFVSQIDRINYCISPRDKNSSQHTQIDQAKAHQKRSGFVYEQTSEIDIQKLELSQQTQEQSILLSNLSNTVVGDNFERNIVLQRPRTILLENKITPMHTRPQTIENSSFDVHVQDNNMTKLVGENYSGLVQDSKDASSIHVLPGKKVPQTIKNSSFDVLVQDNNMTKLAGENYSGLVQDSKDASSIHVLPEHQLKNLQQHLQKHIQEEEEVTIKISKQSEKMFMDANLTQLSSIRSIMQQTQNLNCLELASYEKLTQGLIIKKRENKIIAPDSDLDENNKSFQHQQQHLELLTEKPNPVINSQRIHQQRAPSVYNDDLKLKEPLPVVTQETQHNENSNTQTDDSVAEVDEERISQSQQLQLTYIANGQADFQQESDQSSFKQELKPLQEINEKVVKPLDVSEYLQQTQIANKQADFQSESDQSSIKQVLEPIEKINEKVIKPLNVSEYLQQTYIANAQADFQSESDQSSIKQVSEPIQEINEKAIKLLDVTPRKQIAIAAFEENDSDESSIQLAHAQEEQQFKGKLSVRTKGTEGVPQYDQSMNKESDLSSLHMPVRPKEQASVQNSVFFEDETQLGVLKEDQLEQEHHSDKSHQNIYIDHQAESAYSLVKAQSSNIFERAHSEVPLKAMTTIRNAPLLPLPIETNSSLEQQAFLSCRNQVLTEVTLAVSLPEQSTVRDKQTKTPIKVNQHEVASSFENVEVSFKEEYSSRPEINETDTHRVQTKTPIKVNQHEVVSSFENVEVSFKEEYSSRPEIKETDTHRVQEARTPFFQDSFVSSIKSGFKEQLKVLTPKKEEVLVATQRGYEASTPIKYDIDVSSLQQNEAQSPSQSTSEMQDKAEIGTQREQQVMSPLKQDSEVSSIQNLPVLDHFDSPKVVKEKVKHSTPRIFRTQALLQSSVESSSLMDVAPILPLPQSSPQQEEEDVEIETNRDQGYKIMAIHNDSNISSLHEVINNSMPPQPEQKSLKVKPEVPTPRNKQAKLLIKQDTFVSSQQNNSLLKPHEQLPVLKQILSTPKKQIDCEGATNRGTQVKTMLKLDSNISSQEDVPAYQIPSLNLLTSHQKKEIQIEIETLRDTEVKKLLKKDTNVSSLQENNVDFDASSQPLRQLSKPEVETKRDVKQTSPLRQDDSDSSLHDGEQVEIPSESVKSDAELETLRDTKAKSLQIYAELEAQSWQEVGVKVALVMEPPSPHIVEIINEAQTQRQVIKTRIERGSDSGLSNLPKALKVVNRPRSAKKQKIVLTSSCTQRSKLQGYSLKSQSSIGNIKQLSERQQTQACFAPRPISSKSKPQDSSKCQTIQKQESNSDRAPNSETMPLNSLSLHDRGVAVSVQENDIDKLHISLSYSNQIQSNGQCNGTVAKDIYLSHISIAGDTSELQTQKPEEVAKLIKFNPSKIKSVKTNKSSGHSSIFKQQQNSQSATIYTQNNSKHTVAQDGQQSSLTEIVTEAPTHLEKQHDSGSNVLTNGSMEQSTVNDVTIERGIRYLYVSQQKLQRFNTTSTKPSPLFNSGLAPQYQKNQSIPNSVDPSLPSSQTKGNKNFSNSVVDREDSFEQSKGTVNQQRIVAQEEYERDIKNRPLTPVPEQVSRVLRNTSVIINDWRAGVQVKFEVTGPNSSMIQLCQDGNVIDTKSVAFNLLKISQNYDVSSMEQFCTEWLMPCVSVKDAEWIMNSIQEDPESSLPTLQLQIHGEMLSELVFKQFTMFDRDSGPTSAITSIKNDDEKDEARMYTQLFSSQDETPISSEKSPNQKVRAIEVDGVSTENYLQVMSDNATTILAQNPAHLSQYRIPLERSATEQFMLTRKDSQTNNKALSNQNKSVHTNENKPLKNLLTNESSVSNNEML